MDVLKLIDEFIELVMNLSPGPITPEQRKQLQELDAKIFGGFANSQLADQLSNIRLHSGQPFGFLGVPSSESREGVQLKPTNDWLHQMEGLKEAYRQRLAQIPDDDMKAFPSVEAVARYVDKQLEGNATSKSIAKWMADGSLRSRRRGKLIDICLSDLRALTCEPSD